MRASHKNGIATSTLTWQDADITYTNLFSTFLVAQKTLNGF